MLRTRTHSTLLAVPLLLAVVGGLAACGGDDDDAAADSLPEVTAPDSESDTTDADEPETSDDEAGSDETLPGGVTIPDVTMPEIPDVSIPDVTAAEFSGEGSEAFCAMLADLEDEFDELGDDPASMLRVGELYAQIAAAAPDEIAGDLATLTAVFEEIAPELEALAEDFDADTTDPAALTAALDVLTPMLESEELLQATANLEAYDEEFCGIS